MENHSTTESPPRAEQEFWNGRFAGADYLFGTEPNEFLVSQRHRLHSGQQALMVADGEGRNGVWLAQQGLSVVSVDFSPVAQAKARMLANRAGVSMEVVEANIGDWAWPEKAFDLVAAIFIQFAPPEMRERIFVGMEKALKPGGVLIMQGYRPEQVDYGTGGPPRRENMYTESLLRAAFGDMNILHLEQHDSVIKEGTGHDGISALIDFVAQKHS